MWGLPAIRFVAITSSLDFVHSIHYVYIHVKKNHETWHFRLKEKNEAT